MDDVDNFHIQQTPPPSPYHETSWNLKLDQVEESLLHPKEKKLGYLELYYQGFMEFVDDEQPSPEMSDDETEYPRWGSMLASRDKNSMSSATSVASQDFSTSITGDSDPHICATPQRLATPDRDNKDVRDLHLAIASHPKLLRSRYYPKRPLKVSQRNKHTMKRYAVIGKSRISKKHATDTHTIQTRSKLYTRHHS